MEEDVRIIPALLGVLALTGLFTAAGCARNPPRVDGVEGVAPAPQTPWSGPIAGPPAPPPRGVDPAVPLAEIADRPRGLTLAEAVDVALRNSPDTRAAWYDAQAAAARYGSEQGARFPTVDAEGSATRANDVAQNWATTTGVGVGLSYLLFDFGGRANDIEGAKQALLFADWTHNAVLQDKILEAEIAFFACAGAMAILEADRMSLTEADSSLSAAQARHEIGLATIADVLQARTARSEASLAVLTVAGQVRKARGALAVAMGYPADASGAIEIAAPAPPDPGALRTAEAFIDRAVAARPDLLAARARAQELAAEARAERARSLPSLSLGAFSNRTWIDGAGDASDRHSAALVLNVPLFSGFSRGHDLRAAQARAAAGQERARGYEQAVVYEVFAAHSDLQTATESVAMTAELLAAAAQSQEVAAGRYREGVGSILDLLSAQRALASARALDINAHLDWYTALARLARSAGMLGLPGRTPPAPGLELPEVKP